MAFEIVFSFGFQLGNIWFGLGSSSPFRLEFDSNIFALGLARVGLSFTPPEMSDK
jgi:hypothetical protein